MTAKSYFVETYGCQMNAHDSERIAGLLEGAGMVPVQIGTDADVIVFNTCAVRENADNKLYGNLSHLANLKETRPNMQIAVGGCLAQKDKETIIKRAPYVDVVFGTHNVGSLPILLERARIEKQAQVEIKEALEHFPSTLPSKRFSAFSAWVSISVGCNNTCTFCIVPQLRGNEKDRDAKDVVAEAQALVEQGVIEITLLGQNVNAYGVDVGDRGAFAKLLREVGSIDGLKRLRFMSPHPRDFTDDVLQTMAEVPTLMPHLHMPLQSGSDRILQAMRRSYRTDRYLGILERARKAIPGVQITTDIIVGFPGETDEDHQATMDLCTQAQFAAAYTYQYSKRPNTPAAEMPNQVSADDVKRRYDALHAHQNAICLEVNQRCIGNNYEALVIDNHNGRVTGRIEDNRLVHFDSAARPGDLAEVKITAAENHYLTGIGGQVTATKGGDVFNEKASTMLGIPKLFNSTKPKLTMNNKSLIVICGPTASGKSQLAIDIAKEVGGEIVNADTMSFYRNMNIGTAKVMSDQMQGIAHHMIDVLDITEDANVAWYQHQARKVIDDIIARGKRPILVGGTGLYIKAVVDEMNFPETNPEIRDRLNAEAEALGKAAMYERLKELDPAAAIAIDSQNLRRIIRALEVIEITGKPYTANLPQAGASYYPDAIWIGLSVPREVLDERITVRAEQMFENGLIDETRDLVLDGLMSGTTARLGHGYAQIIEFQMGLNMDPIEETIIVTRQYARRQETWFKREARINWIEAPFLEKALKFI